MLDQKQNQLVNILNLLSANDNKNSIASHLVNKAHKKNNCIFNKQAKARIIPKALEDCYQQIGFPLRELTRIIQNINSILGISRILECG